MGQIHEVPFHPLPFLTSGKWQTIAASYGLPLKEPSLEEWILDLEGGDKLSVNLYIPRSWREENGIVSLMHGLGGSDRSHYMRRMTRRLYDLGVLVVGINRRGCGSGAGLAKRHSHGGLTADTLLALREVRRRYPKAKLQAVGFSMGGNILLKLLGELGDDAEPIIARGIAVCPIVDFFDTCDHMCQPSMRLFNDYYVNALVALAKEAERAFPDIKKIDFPERMTIEEYDRLYTVPKWGFASLEEYYQTSASNQFVPKIRVPCDILFSEDDPVIRCRTIEALRPPPAVNLWKTRQGGHLGFLGWSKEYRGIRWMDHKLLSWLK